MAVLVVACLVPAGRAQQSPPAGGDGAQPTFRTGIDFVRVDVIVTDKGQPVTDLTQADFEVREDGQAQAIEQFRLIKVDNAARQAQAEAPQRTIRNRDDEESEAARDDVRVIVFFLDDYHTRVANAISVKKPLLDFIETQVRPNDLLAVMGPLTPVSELRFTRNKAAIESAINAFEGRKFRYQPRNQFEEQYSRMSTEQVENLRNSIVMGALRGLSVRLGSIREGRKNVVFVSEGFTALLPPQLRNSDAEAGSGLPNGVSSGAGENSRAEDTARAFATGDINLRLREVFTLANRNNTAFYALDPRGLATNEFGIEENVGPQQDRVNLQATQDTLRTLAEQTDGKAIVNRNDLSKGLQQVVQDGSVYYLIGYTSSQSKTDGKFHEIKVSVKRRGVDVRARRGYWAATADDVERATKATVPAPPANKAFENALAVINPSVQGNQAVRTWLGSARGAAGKTQLTLIWEPIAGPPGARREVPGRVSVIAARESGELVYRGRSVAESGAARGSTSPTTVSTLSGPTRVAFEAPPGPLELRLSIEDAGGSVIDSEVRRVTVPDLTAPQPALSTPRVFRARTARDLQGLVQDASAVPLASREFSRGDRVLIRFDAYGVGTESPSVKADILNRNGQKMADVPVAPATAGGTHQIDLGLASMASGDYVLEVVVTAGGSEARELVPIRVGS